MRCMVSSDLRRSNNSASSKRFLLYELVLSTVVHRKEIGGKVIGIFKNAYKFPCLIQLFPYRSVTGRKRHSIGIIDTQCAETFFFNERSNLVESYFCSKFCGYITLYDL